MNWEIVCGKCEIKINNQKISLNIPGGIRGCGPSRTLYFCSDECKELYEKTEICQVCRCAYQYEIIDGYRVCHDYSSWMYSPTCKEQYTGNYLCHGCDEIVNIFDHVCYIIDDPDDPTGQIQLRLCGKCFKRDIPSKQLDEPYDKHINQYWIKIYDNTKDFDLFLDLLKLRKACGQKFVCNNCKVIRSIDKGLHIKDNKNLCHLCIDISDNNLFEIYTNDKKTSSYKMYDLRELKKHKITVNTNDEFNKIPDYITFSLSDGCSKEACCGIFDNQSETQHYCSNECIVNGEFNFSDATKRIREYVNDNIECGMGCYIVFI